MVIINIALRIIFNNAHYREELHMFHFNIINMQ